MSGADFTLDEVTTILRNVGWAVNCPACAGIAFTGSWDGVPHTCERRFAASPFRDNPDRIVEIGTPVRTTQREEHSGFALEGLASQKWGVTGKIAAYHDSHGLHYEVEHSDGTIGHYTPNEIEVTDWTIAVVLSRKYAYLLDERGGERPAVIERWGCHRYPGWRIGYNCCTCSTGPHDYEQALVLHSPIGVRLGMARAMEAAKVANIAAAVGSDIDGHPRLYGRFLGVGRPPEVIEVRDFPSGVVSLSPTASAIALAHLMMKREIGTRLVIP